MKLLLGNFVTEMFQM